MKNLYAILWTLAFIIPESYAQINYSEDFESYTVGDYIGVESEQWSTWSGTTGGAEDAQVVDDQANSGSNSIYFKAIGSAGPQDVVLLFDGLQTSGIFTFESSFYIPAGKSAYFNFQGAETIGQVWALEVYLNTDGTLSVNGINVPYPQDEWFKLGFNINLTLNIWTLLINDVQFATWANDINAVSMTDFFPASSNDEFWIDDVSFSIDEYVTPDLNLAAQALTMESAGLVGQTLTPTLTVLNAGSTTITSFDIEGSYNGIEAQSTVSDIALLPGESLEVDYPDEITLVEGDLFLTAAVSNPNEQGEDDVSEDDAVARVISPAIPAAGKVVIAEEGTGTWCGWCPRGTVAMDHMAENYKGYYYGIAVHNQDPMVVAEYDESLGFSAFPGAMVERGDIIDPSQIEARFLTAIEQAPAATLEMGAQWNDGILDVSVGYTFLEEITGNYKVLCVLTEDSVTGTGSDYSQVNYYAGGANGPMGGFEDLPSTVPFSQMHYNHVARSTIPGANGLSDAFPEGAMPGTTHVFNFSFPIDEDWDPEQLHIIGMLIEPNGTINNGGGASIDEAIENGYEEGLVVVGVNEINSASIQLSSYPNPTDQVLNVEFQLNDQQPVSIEILDAMGKIIWTEQKGMQGGTQRYTLDMSNLQAGMYFLKLRINQQTITEKITKH
jgi:hypothetical protein